jgi:hypothetical protein
MTRKDYAIKLGLASKGRGRLSRAAHAACDAAEADGVVFVDRKTSTSVNASPLPGAPIHAEPGTEVAEDPYAHHPAPTRSGMLMFSNGNTTLDKVSSKEACAECGRSFGWCRCAIPTFRYWKTQEVLNLNGEGF